MAGGERAWTMRAERDYPAGTMATYSEGKRPGELEQLVAKELEALTGMTRRQLQRRWLELFPTAAHPRLSRSLLVSILSYRMQEEAFGGLPPELCGRLRNLNRNPHRQSRRQTSSGQERESTVAGALRKKQPATRVQLRPGTRLLRQWRGQTYVVTVGEHGYEYGENGLLAQANQELKLAAE